MTYFDVLVGSSQNFILCTRSFIRTLYRPFIGNAKWSSRVLYMYIKGNLEVVRKKEEKYKGNC